MEENPYLKTPWLMPLMMTLLLKAAAPLEDVRWDMFKDCLTPSLSPLRLIPTRPKMQATDILQVTELYYLYNLRFISHAGHRI